MQEYAAHGGKGKAVQVQSSFRTGQAAIIAKDRVWTAKR